MDVPRVTVDEVKARLDRGEPIAFIDARSPESWSKSDVQIKGSLRVPVDDVAKRLSDIPRDRSIVVYCT
jgi:rhodanese-related sulfurtransferase